MLTAGLLPTGASKDRYNRAPDSHDQPAGAGRETADRIRFILETLAESRQSGLTVGRDYLLEKGRNNNLILSQYEVREILATLEREQYVKISKGRGGTRITEKGLALLNEDLSTDLQ